MSQVSPDGRYVVDSIEVPGAHGGAWTDACAGFLPRDYGFGQVFFPTRGVLAWYTRASGKLQPLPGADDPHYVRLRRLLESRREVPGVSRAWREIRSGPERPRRLRQRPQ